MFLASHDIADLWTPKNNNQIALNIYLYPESKSAGEAVRTLTGRIAGKCLHDQFFGAYPVRAGEVTNIEVIALSSTAKWSSVLQHLNHARGENFGEHLSTSITYGCPCSVEIGSGQLLDHIPECSDHPDFERRTMLQDTLQTY